MSVSDLHQNRGSMGFTLCLFKSIMYEVHTKEFKISNNAKCWVLELALGIFLEYFSHGYLSC